MNKYTVTIFLLFSFFVSLAQQHALLPNPKTGRFEFPAHEVRAKVFNKTTVSDWYSPLSWAANDSVGPTLQYSIGFLQHDSLAKIVYADGATGHNTWISAGRVLDPKDNIIDSINPAMKLSKHNDFSLDSIRFKYAYVRHVDSIGLLPVVDTLFISYFKGSNIHQHLFTETKNKFGIVDWVGGSIRMPLNYFDMDTILLGSADSTGIANTNGKFENFINLKTMAVKAPGGISVVSNSGTNDNNLLAYTFTFKSAVPSVSGTDTSIMLYQKDPSTLPPSSRRNNSFGFYYATDTISWSNKTFYNTSLLAPHWAAYQLYNGWYGYTPGNAFVHDYFIDADFYLTTSANVGISSVGYKEKSVALFPNPIVKGDYLNVIVPSENTETASLYNMIGECVARSQSGGDGIATGGLNAGIYLLTVKTGTTTASKKVVILE